MCCFTGPGKAVLTKRLSAGPCIWTELCCPGGYLTVTMKNRPLWFPPHTPKLPWWVLCDGEAWATSLSYLIHVITIQLWPFLGSHNSFFFLNKLLNLLSFKFFSCFTISTLVSPEFLPRSLSHPGVYWMVMIRPGSPCVPLVHSYHEYWMTALPEPTSLFILVFYIYFILISLLM
jgi:hypothetical protein